MKYATKRRIYKSKWNKKHRKQINKTRKMHRKLKKQHIKKLENQIKLIPILNNKVNNLQNELINSRSKLIGESKLKKQISQLKFKIQFLDKFKTTLTKDYILLKSSNNKNNHRIVLLEDKLSQLDTLRSENKSLASKYSSAASIIKASKSKSADEMSSNKSFLMGKSKEGFFRKLF